MLTPENGIAMQNALLTPKEVANLLKVSTRTVYDHADDLGGFYPAGIGALRFNQRTIDVIMERQTTESMAVLFPVPGRDIYRKRIHNTAPSGNDQVIQTVGSKEAEKTDRHGLFAISRCLPNRCRKKVCNENL